VAFAFAGLGPGLFGKRPDGTVPLGRRVWFVPYHLLSAIAAQIGRIAGEAPADEIEPGLFLGRRLTSLDRQVGDGGFAAVLDLTSEFPEPDFLRAAMAYLCIPLLDNSAPTVAQLDRAMDFLARAPRPLLVHCAYGHGRSAVVICAWLLKSGLAHGPEEAEALVRRKRSKVSLSREQREAVKAWQEERNQSPEPIGGGLGEAPTW
jgi:Dual specificity phosphatase, catalytic domain